MGAADRIVTFLLLVTDNDGATATDTVVITVEAPNAAPTANAGTDETVASGAEVTLDGSGSNDNGDLDGNGSIATYAWTASDGITLTGANTASPGFTAPTLAAGAEDVTRTFTLTVTDNDGATATDTVVITVATPNAAPTANAGPDQPVAFGGTVTLDGSGSNDSDGSIASYAWTAPPDITLSGADTAGPTFTAPTFAAGTADVPLTFALTVRDNDGATSRDRVVITVESPNARPVADAGPDQTVASGAEVTLDGSRSNDRRDLDGDGSIAFYFWFALDGITLSDQYIATPTFTAPRLDAGAADVTLTFLLLATDNDGATASDRVVITVEAPNDGPTADAGPDQTVASDAEVTLDGSASSASDGSFATYAWTGPQGITLTGGDTAEPTFTTPTLMAGQVWSFTFTLTVTDNDGATATDTVVITVEAPNAAPTANAGPNQTVASGAAVSLDGSGSSDRNGSIASYAWTAPNGIALTGANTVRPSFDAPTLAAGAADVTRTFTLTVTDNDGATATDTVVITVEAPNAAPTANAGSDRTVPSAALVTLDGSGSNDNGDLDGNGSIATYAWTASDGVTLTGTNTVSPGFTAPTLAAGAVDVTRTFTLTVTDNDGATASDRVVITVEAPNVGPTADTGPDRTVASGAEVTLDGSGSSDSEASIATYAWTGPQGITLTGANTARPSFDAPALAAGAVDRILTFLLLVTDTEGASAFDRVIITVEAPNAVPTANAGPDRTVAPGDTVTLDGSGSNDDGDLDGDGLIATYAWTASDGVTLTGANTASPGFTAPTLDVGAADVPRTFTLTVTDNDGATATDTVVITVEAPNAVPTANAGRGQTVASGATVALDGSASSDSEGSIASYAWSGPAGITLIGADTAGPTFSAPTLMAGAADRILTFTLTVTDNGASTARDTVVITVESANAAPTANAGPDQTVASEATVTLDGSGSNDNGDLDGNGSIATYAWTASDGTTLTGAETARPGFTAPTLVAGAADVTRTFTLTVTDNDGATATDTVVITVEAPNAAPTADAGDDRTVASGAEVMLDGSGSNDDGDLDGNGSIATYAWTASDGTTLTGAETARPGFTAPTLVAGAADVTRTFTLTVTDNDGATATDTVVITVEAPNAAPTADAGDDRTVASGAEVMLDGSGSNDDGDLDGNGSIVTYTWFGQGIPLRGAGPTFTAPTLEVGSADRLVTFLLLVTDNVGTPAFDRVIITVEAPNAAPTANAGLDRTVAPGDTVTLDGSGSNDNGDLDGNGSIATYAWTASDGVTLSGADTAGPTFTALTLAAGAADATRTFTLTVTDNDGATGEDTVTITIEAPNAAPMANAGQDQTVASGATVTLDGSASSDGDGRIASYVWTGSAGITLTGADTAAPTFTAPTLVAGAADRMLTFTLTITDNGESIASDTVVITVEAPNAAPMANAGRDQTVASGAEVTLDGSGSNDNGDLDGDGSIESYEWTLPSFGNDVLYRTEMFRLPTETLAAGAADVILIFTLTVTDNDGATATDTVVITVEAPNAAPTANAGPDQTVPSAASAMLDGSGSSASDGSIASYAWTASDGITLAGTDTAAPSFTAPTLAAGAADVILIFTLTVTDNDGATASDTVMITVEAPNAVPTANAGQDQTVASGAEVMLDGSGSNDNGDLDGDGSIETYAWTATDGITLTGADTAGPTFTAPTLVAGAADVTRTFTLTVTDNDGATATDTVIITVEAPNAAPTANAGPDRTVGPGSSRVTLDGSGSNDNGDLDGNGSIETYAWTASDGITLTGPDTAKPTFNSPILAAGTANRIVRVTLTVTDNEGATDSDTVAITFDAASDVPRADAGPDRTVASGATVILEVYGANDKDGSIVIHAWTAPDGITLSDVNAAAPIFTAPTLVAGTADVVLTFLLLVTDRWGATGFDTVVITVEAPNAAPTADAGPDRTVASGAEVMLDGSGSNDNGDLDGGGSIASYEWTASDGVTLTGAETARPGFTAPTLAAGAADVTRTFTLTVTDNEGATATDTVVITVEAPNAAPTADAGPDRTVDSGAEVMLDGSGSNDNGDLDGDGSIETYAWTASDGVTLTGAETARPSFTAPPLAAGAVDVTRTFTLTVTDNDGATATDTVVITVEAPNAAPTANAGSDQTVDSGDTVTLDGSGSNDDGDLDGDGSITAYRWTAPDGITLSRTIRGSTAFIAPTLAAGAADRVLTFTLTVTDNDGATATDTVVITVEAPNAAPTANAGSDQTVDSGDTVTLDGSGSNDDGDLDGDGSITAYRWTAPDGITLSRTIRGSTAFIAPTLAAGAADRVLTFTLTVTDNDGATATDTVVITVEAPNAAPTANAGSDQTVDSGDTVTLDGSGSNDDGDLDGDGSITAYRWTAPDGITLTGANTASPGFTAPTLVAGAKDWTITVTLRVTDNDGATATDTVVITVESANVAPRADAGPAQTVASGAEVTLDGSASNDNGDLDGDGSIETYTWYGRDGITLIGGDTAMPSFTAPTLAAGATDVPLRFSLVVWDNEGRPGGDSVFITVEAPNAAPTADAGPDRPVDSGTTVTLDGSGSNDNGDLDGHGSIETYAWTASDGVTLTGADTAMPSFTAPTLDAGAADRILTFTLTVTDNGGAAATDRVVITVEAPNAVPTANAGTDETVASGARVRLNGAASNDNGDLDGHGSIATYAWTGPDGITLRRGNTFRSAFTAPRLATGAKDRTLTFTLTVTDNAGATATDTVVITVESPNVAPTADAGPDQTVDSGDPVTLDGSGSNDDGDLDGDGSITTYEWTAPDGITLTGANTASPGFTAPTLAAGAFDVTRTFTLTVTDNDGATATDTVVITVEAPNAAPTANAGPDQTVDSGDPVTLDGSASNDDGDLDGHGSIETYAWISSNGITLTGADTAMPSFTAPNLVAGAADWILTFTLTVTDNDTGRDNEGATATDTVVITVQAPNAWPTANAGPDRTVASGAEVTLDGSASSDSDGSITSHSWSAPNSITLIGGDTAMPSFTAPTLAAGATDVPLRFSLVVWDNEGRPGGDSVFITVEAPNAAPTADAGPDRPVDSGTTVTLDGSGSNDNGDLDGHGSIETYAWTASDGVTLTGADTAMPSFTAPTLDAGAVDRILTFTLTVTDNGGAAATDRVVITVEAPNAVPTANAGLDRTVASGARVRLDGSGSNDNGDLDGNGTIATYAWTASDGVTLTGAETARPSFTAPTLAAGAADVTLTFTLTVTDNEDTTATDTVDITVTVDNIVPTANAGPDQTVNSATRVTLDGSASSDNGDLDGDGSITGYEWTASDGITLTGANTASPGFTAPTLAAGAEDVTRTFTLTVTDNDGATDEDTVVITVEAPNAAPTADAGPDQTVDSGAEVMLDGSGSNDNGDLDGNGSIATYAWTASDGVTLTGANTASPSFTAPTLAAGAAIEKLTFTLDVTDNEGATASDTVIIRVEAQNIRPTAAPGPDQTVDSGAEVTLDGSGSSDSDGRITRYAWTSLGGITLTGANTASPGFTAPTLAAGAADVAITATLTVTDNDGATDEDTVIITVEAPNAAPTADAGPDQTVDSGARVTLDGSGSNDNGDLDGNGTIATYAWTAPDGITLSRTIRGSTAFIAPTLAAGAADRVLTFTLTVTDNDGAIASDTVVITVDPQAPNAAPTADAGGGHDRGLRRHGEPGRVRLQRKQCRPDPHLCLDPDRRHGREPHRCR